MAVNKILRIVETWGNVFTKMSKPQIAYLAQAVSDVILKVAKGAMVWRDAEGTGSKFHIAAEQYTIDPDTGVATPASNYMGEMKLTDAVGNSSSATLTDTDRVTYDVKIAGLDATDPQDFVTKAIHDTSAQSKRSIKHGFVAPEINMWDYNDVTRTITCSHSSGTVEYWSYGVFYSYANGHAKLTHQVPDLNQDSWCYFDNTGQLTSKTELVWDDVKVSCLAPHVKYNPTSDIFYFRIERNEDAEANHVENFASYKTKSLQEAEKVLFDASIGDTQTGHTSGEYFTSRDYQYFVPTQSATVIDWLNYYYDGIDDNFKDCIKLFLSPIPTGRPYILDSDIGLGVADNLIYNEFNVGNDEFDVLVCPSNNYVIGFIATADGGEQKIVALAPQGKYSNLANAQAAIPDAKGNLIGTNNIFKDVTVLSAYIMRGDQIGGFINVGTGSAFYNYEVSLGGGSAAVGSQDLQSVTDNGATTSNPIVVTDGAVSNTISTASSTIAIPTESIKVNPDGIAKADLGAGASSPLIIVNSSTSEPDINITSSGSGDINLVTIGGNTNIENALSTNDATEILALGGTAFQTADSVVNVTSTDTGTLLTAGAGVTITDQFNVLGVGFVVVDVVFSITSSVTTLGALNMSYVPDVARLGSISNDSTGESRPVFINESGQWGGFSALPIGNWVMGMVIYNGKVNL